MGKDQLIIENWQPLMLLCTDYKIFAKIISNRISLVIDQLVSNDQTGFIKSRYIAQNLMDLNCVLLHAETNNIPAAIVAIDFCKAYDSLEWNVMYKILEMYNFGPGIISWINLCYTNISSCVINNGFLSEPLTIQRGLRQGCPLSCFVFDLIIELIAIKIRKNSPIRG